MPNGRIAQDASRSLSQEKKYNRIIHELINYYWFTAQGSWVLEDSHFGSKLMAQGWRLMSQGLWLKAHASWLMARDSRLMAHAVVLQSCHFSNRTVNQAFALSVSYVI